MKVRPDIHTRVFDGELVVLDLVQGDYVGLNDLGARLWDGLVAGKALSEIAEEITAETEVELEVVLKDLMKVTDALIARGLVAPAD